MKVSKKKAGNLVRKKKGLKIVTSHTPKPVYLSMCLAVLSLIMFLTVCIISACFQGKADLYIGVIPFIALLLNIIGFLLSYRYFNKEDIRIKWVTISSFMNALLAIIYLVLYILGIVL